jgi:hypothetical protein
MSKITPTIHITHGKKANHIPIVGPKGSQPQSHMRDINSLMATHPFSTKPIGDIMSNDITTHSFTSYDAEEGIITTQYVLTESNGSITLTQTSDYGVFQWDDIVSWEFEGDTLTIQTTEGEDYFNEIHSSSTHAK